MKMSQVIGAKLKLPEGPEGQFLTLENNSEIFGDGVLGDYTVAPASGGSLYHFEVLNSYWKCLSADSNTPYGGIAPGETVIKYDPSTNAGFLSSPSLELKIMIHQTQCSFNRNNAGLYEIKTIKEIDTQNHTITLDSPLIHSYYTSEDFNKVQIVSIPAFRNLTISQNAWVVSYPWDGDIGGIVALTVNGMITSSTGISVSGQGFRMSNNTGTNGEGIDCINSSSGGGGLNSFIDSDGIYNADKYGTGAAHINRPDGVTKNMIYDDIHTGQLCFGAGGGTGPSTCSTGLSETSSTPWSTGAGGGIIYLNAASISSSIIKLHAMGTPNTSYDPTSEFQSGCGSGGTVYVTSPSTFALVDVRVDCLVNPNYPKYKGADGVAIKRNLYMNESHYAYKEIEIPEVNGGESPLTFKSYKMLTGGTETAESNKIYIFRAINSDITLNVTASDGFVFGFATSDISHNIKIVFDREVNVEGQLLTEIDITEEHRTAKLLYVNDDVGWIFINQSYMLE